MVFKRLESAQARWCADKGPHLLSLIRAGTRFENSNLIERPANQEAISTSHYTPIHRS